MKEAQLYYQYNRGGQERIIGGAPMGTEKYPNLKELATFDLRQIYPEHNEEIKRLVLERGWDFEDDQVYYQLLGEFEPRARFEGKFPWPADAYIYKMTVDIEALTGIPIPPGEPLGY